VSTTQGQGSQGDRPTEAAPAAPATDRRTIAAGEILQTTMGGSARYTVADVAAAARMTPDEVSRLWRAMGFPTASSAPMFTDADLAAVLRISGMLERGLVDLDAVVDVLRSLGQTTSRLTEWQVETVSRYQMRVAPDADWSRAHWEGLTDLLPDVEVLLTYVWRRQLTATLGRMLDELDEADAVPDTATVGFADLVSFTRLSRQLDSDALAMLVHTFETAAADIVHALGGRLVKTLGDEVMFVTDAATTATEIGLRLHDLSRGDADLPAMRVGLATGAVLMLMGDVFGTTVNRASRLTATARPGSIMLDGDTADALVAAGDDRFSVRALAPRPIRGLGLMRPYSAAKGTGWMESAEEAAPEAGELDPASASGDARDAAASAEASSGNT
jgi:adenylate cyclase